MTDPTQPLAWRHVAFLLLSLTMVAAPHAPHLPWWGAAVAATLIAWRAFLGYAGLTLPGRWMLVLIAIAATIGVFVTYRTIFGRDAGIALLVLMLGLKGLETRTLRDAVLLIFLGYFLVITNFLRDQSIATALYMCACTVVITATMIRLHYAGAEPPFRQQLQRASVMLAQAIPLMVVLFVLFPRVPGPLWGLPQDTRTAVSGLSDQMNPGSLSRLILSDEVAFRVKFESPELPSPRLRYWRGPVMWDFDGATWSASRFLYNTPLPETSGEAVSYEVTLEPHNRRWLFGLDIPMRLPPRALIGGDFQILSHEPVKTRIRYQMTSHLNATYGLQESRYALERALRLPPDSNPRTHALARSLRERHADDRALVEAVLSLFRSQNFVYTLEPPLLGKHPVDDFLFSTRSGFCEHFSSAFAVLMRAAGIPARVVTGYQGGELNNFGNYMIVRQSDAHAWTEIWLADRGWVQIDPTFAVSPLRVDSGISAAVPLGDTLPLFGRDDYEILRRLRLSLDFAANSWNQWVLGYTPDRQRWLLSRVGMDDATWEKMTALLFIIGGAVVAVLTLIALRQLSGRARDPVRLAYARFCAKLRRRGLPREPSEGPLDYAHRIGAARPDLAPAVAAITRLYIALRYGLGSGAAMLQEFQRRVRQFTA